MIENLDEDYFHVEKPDVKDSELLCDGCWKVTEKKNAQGWTYVGLKHLSSINLCPECMKKDQEFFNQIQGAGL